MTKTGRQENQERWAHQGSNLGPTGYEPVALPTELWALRTHQNFSRNSDA